MNMVIGFVSEYDYKTWRVFESSNETWIGEQLVAVLLLLQKLIQLVSGLSCDHKCEFETNVDYCSCKPILHNYGKNFAWYGLQCCISIISI